MNPRGLKSRIRAHLAEHLEEADMGYWSHLTHAVHQSNLLIVAAIKSYIHGVFPFWYKAAGPKTIIEMYYQIRQIRHINKLERQMRADTEVSR